MQESHDGPIARNGRRAMIRTMETRPDETAVSTADAIPWRDAPFR